MDVNENLFCHWKMEFPENRWDCFFIISMIPLSIVLFGALPVGVIIFFYYFISFHTATDKKNL